MTSAVHVMMVLKLRNDLVESIALCFDLVGTGSHGVKDCELSRNEMEIPR